MEGSTTTVYDILLVDDDEHVRRALERTLKLQGYVVVTAENGEKGLQALKRGRRPPKVIIVDLMMPVMDGWKFRLSLLEQPHLAGIPVIVLSGSACIESGRALPAVEYIEKPLRLPDFLDTVARLMAMPALPN